MKTKTWYIIGGVALALGLGYFIWTKTKKTDSGEKSSSNDFDDFDDEEIVTDTADSRFTSPVAPKLNSIQNKRVASYLSGLLSDSEQTTLRGWINLINQAKAKDPSKWGDANGLTGEKAVIGHALYQMKKGNQCANCWNQTILIDLMDA
jgi:hypothetical protein